jgi:hypothetical protein
MAMRIPDTFITIRNGSDEERRLVVREGFDREAAAALLDRVDAVDWTSVSHAYGAADDVPGQLTAVVAGDDTTRNEAWWNLWGNIHHQGTIYEATAPAVPILLGIAAWREHPDRGQALLMLRYVAGADEADADLRAAIESGTEPLLAAWRSEPESVRRPLLWLLPVLPDLRDRHPGLIAETLPDEHRHAWEIELAGASDDWSWDDSDAVNALEEWVTEPLQPQ